MPRRTQQKCASPDVESETRVEGDLREEENEGAASQHQGGRTIIYDYQLLLLLGRFLRVGLWHGAAESGLDNFREAPCLFDVIAETCPPLRLRRRDDLLAREKLARCSDRINLTLDLFVGVRW